MSDPTPAAQFSVHSSNWVPHPKYLTTDCTCMERQSHLVSCPASTCLLLMRGGFCAWTRLSPIPVSLIKFLVLMVGLVWWPVGAIPNSNFTHWISPWSAILTFLQICTGEGDSLGTRLMESSGLGSWSDVQVCHQRLSSPFDFLLIFLCSLIQTLTLTPPPNNALLANMNVYRHMLASFPGPTQLSVACSMRGKSPGTRVAMCMALSSFLGLVHIAQVWTSVQILYCKWQTRKAW